MRRPLVVAAAQPDCVPGDVIANAAAHAEVVERVAANTPDVRVVVFPELSLTGYELEAPVVDPGDPALEPVVRAGTRAGVLVLAGAPVGDAEASDHLAMLAIDERGVRVAYRKMWLGPAEAVRFTPGTELAAIDVDGWRLGLAICKDTGVAEHAAATVALGIDALVAGVLEHAADGDVAGERARRIASEHGVWVVVASFAGSTGGGYDEAAGGSGIWAPDGTAADRAGPKPGEFAVATLR